MIVEEIKKLNISTQKKSNFELIGPHLTASCKNS